MAIVEFIQANPKISILILAVVVTFISTIVTKWLTNQEHLKELKKRQKEIQKELKNQKDNPKVFSEMQNEMLQITGTMMKSSFKPVLITMVPFLILFYWIRSLYGAPSDGGEALLAGWFWWYLGGSVAAGLIWRKVLKMA